MFCSNCGARNNRTEKFCSQCGHDLVNATVAKDGSEFSAYSDQKDDYLLEAFVGKNNSYYKNKWEKMNDSGKSISWNWAAFILGLFWLGYRKMYKPIFIILTVFLLGDLLEIFTGYHALVSTFISYLPILLYTGVGLYANTLYYRHAKAKIAETNQSFNDQEYVKEMGGTSGKGVVAAILIIFAYALIATFFYNTFPNRSIEFGTREAEYGIADIKDTFTADEHIYYEVNFGERAETSHVDVHVLILTNNTETMFAQFQEGVDPSWHGFYNHLYNPDYDVLEPGTYIVRAYRWNELLSEGAFQIE